jgi:hypothetical protein
MSEPRSNPRGGCRSQNGETAGTRQPSWRRYAGEQPTGTSFFRA